MRNAGLEEAQAGIKIAGRNIHNLRYADDTTLMAESEEELKSLLRKVKEESEKIGLKLNIHGIWSHHFIANRWANSGNSVRLFSWAPESLQMVTVAMKLKDVCSLKEKLWSTRQHIKKKRHYFANEGPSIVKAMVFPVVMYGCECWTIKKAECQKIDAFELWCWRRVPWTTEDPASPS